MSAHSPKDLPLHSRKNLLLPAAPAHLTGPVKVWREPVEILSYEPDAPNANPMFLEKRVYQGSSGRVYPLPFYDRIGLEPATRLWEAIHLENEHLRIMILPEIGGRIHVGYDKVTGYDFFYRQNVIKPALVGLAGPWISGGVEFNWPQHHRPATFLPVNTEIEQHSDGSATVWCSDHDPMERMKGMHGVCLHPGRSVLELKVRLYNRTAFTQSFLWWANVATRVHEQYQSFFPTDVRFVADHAKRAITTFPLSEGLYYGIDYGERGREGVHGSAKPAYFMPDGSYAANDISWYANIPVPTSYMVSGTSGDFFGGYDHTKQAGVVHVANHHIAPGKKQWTWGNHEFGYAWDRNLTDSDGPYIELMAGVYTDNQPDFSYLAPWETKTFTQTWYPLRGSGVPQAVNEEAALRLEVADGEAHVRVQVTRDRPELRVALFLGDAVLHQWQQAASASQPLRFSAALPKDAQADALRAEVWSTGRRLLSYDPRSLKTAAAPKTAVEPAEPSAVANVEELYLTGLHLEQYRHATRSPEPYWQEALRRDAGNSQASNAFGLLLLRRGEFQSAINSFQNAIARLTALNPNPRDGEAFYNLGLAQRLLSMEDPAYDSFYKATWNAAWRSPAYFALAEMDAGRGEWERVLDHLRHTLNAEADHLHARNLRIRALRAVGRTEEAAEQQKALRALDPLDLLSRWADGIAPSTGQERLDLAYDLSRAGQKREALDVLSDYRGEPDGSQPMILFAKACLARALGRDTEAERAYQEGELASLLYCFPSRLEDMIVLERIRSWYPESPSAAYLLGLVFYDRRRYADAIELWKRSAELRPDFPTVWRNLGIAAFNVLHDANRARADFDRAFLLDPHDGRVLYERDQLWKRTGVAPGARVAELMRYRETVLSRDDLAVEFATLLNTTGKPEEALELLTYRVFQPWEGGEGLVLAQFVRARILLGRSALQAGDVSLALDHFLAGKSVPENLSEAKHLLANRADIEYWIGTACEAVGRAAEASLAWESSASQRGDFQQMAVRTVSDMTYWTALALRKLGRLSEATRVFEHLLAYAAELDALTPKIDYFATSLPTLLLFDEDLERQKQIQVWLLQAQAYAGLDRLQEARAALEQLLDADPSHPFAVDLWRELFTSIAEGN